MKYLSWEFNRFIFFGAVNSLLSYMIYLILLSFLNYPTAYTLAYVAGILISYYLNTKFVFKEQFDSTKALKYPLVYLVQYVLGILLLYIAVVQMNVSKWLAPLLVVLLTWPVIYFLSRFIIKGRAEHLNKS